ncbi:MAG: aromatic aminobenezylarsenical efflux permease ArsG family transporter [bacterium]
MTEIFIGLGTSLWLGILTSISPCPLATNIAAISFIGKRVDSSRKVFFSGAAYALGRTITYLALGVILVSSLMSVPGVSYFLQKYTNRILGPVLILAGMFLLELIQLNISGPGVGENIQRRVEKSGLFGALMLGVAFALSFCPVSAALFFGSLIPLAIKFESGVMLPAIYGVGTALPVIAFALLIAFGAQSVGKAFDSIKKIEFWARRATGVIFIGVGIYISLKYVFEVL